MKEDKENNGLELGQGSTLAGVAILAAVVMHNLKVWQSVFENGVTIKAVGELYLTVLAALFVAYLVFMIGVILYNVVLRRLEFLKLPLLKALVIGALACGVLWVFNVWWG